MKTITGIQDIILNYKAGLRWFINLNFDKSEKLTEQILEDTTFDNCCFSVDFSRTNFTNSKFINCNLKDCDFSLCNLTKVIFENCSLESAEFKNANIFETNLSNCHCYGQSVSLNKATGEIETFKDPLVKELYDNVPEFNKLADHSNDELPYSVYGELSIKLFEDIVASIQVSDFTKKCFRFFNQLGDRQDNSLDNLLVVGIYEGLYLNKKCNDIARQLLTGRNRDIYEHWMINGNIRSDY